MYIKYWKLPLKPCDEWYCRCCQWWCDPRKDFVINEALLLNCFFLHIFIFVWTFENVMPFEHVVLNHVNAIYANTQIKKIIADGQILKTLFWLKSYFTKKYNLNRDRPIKSITNYKNFDQVWQTSRYQFRWGWTLRD